MNKPAVTATAKGSPHGDLSRPAPKKRRGRPRIGDYRLHLVIPEPVYQRLLERAQASGVEPTRMASQLLIKALIS